MTGNAGSGRRRPPTRGHTGSSERGRPRSPGGAGRGQSGIDFVVGFGIFFLTLSFVLVLAPELLAPFGAQESPVVADRAVETLASDLLAGGPVGTLDERCTVDFFRGSGDACPFDPGESTAALLGVSVERGLNVTLERDVDADGELEVVCHDGAGVATCPSNGGLARGRVPPGDTQSVRTARRVVTVDGEAYFLQLRVW